MKTLLAILLSVAACSAQNLKMNMGPITHYNDQHGGRNGWPNNGRYFDGDTQRSTWCSDNKTYVSFSDGLGPNASLSSGRNIFLGWISDYTTNAAGMLLTMVNSMDDFGTITQTNTNGWSDGASWKSGGLHCQGGVMYLSVWRQVFSTFEGQNASIMKSLDNGATWCSPSHTNHTTGACTITPSATGDAPTNGQNMFGSTGVREWYFVQYGQDGGTGGTVVENNDTWVYMIGDGQFYMDGHMYLGRMRITDLPKLDGSLQQYYKGGTCTADASWSTNSSLKLAATGAIDGLVTVAGAPVYLPALSAYVIQIIDLPGNVTFWKSPSICGPWTLLYTNPTNSMIQAWFYPTLKSIATANGATTMLWGSGASTAERSGNPDLNSYSLHFNVATFFAPAATSMTGRMTISGKASIQ